MGTLSNCHRKPVEGVSAYLYNSSGTYLFITGVTQADGTVAFIVPEGDYQVRFDFMGGEYWSGVSAVSPDGTTVASADPGGATVTVTVEDGLGGIIDGVPLFVYRDTGAYLNLTASTDVSGQVSFTLPAGSFKVAGDRLGFRFWTAAFDPEAIAVGGSAAVQSLRGASTTRQSHANGVIVSPERSHGRGNPGEVQVASLFMLPGMLAGLSNSAFADSNGEHLYFYHSDHLGTPLFLTDTDSVVVWRGEYLPFGEVFSEDKDPDGDGNPWDRTSFPQVFWGGRKFSPPCSLQN